MSSTVVDRIGKDGSLARASIEAALQRHADAARAMSERAQSFAASSAKPADAVTNTNEIARSLRDVDATVKRADALVEDVVTGKVQDFHEAALRLKEADLALKFALEVRNKFVDAYREVMRMNV